MDKSKIIIIENRDEEFEDLKSVINEEFYEIKRYITIQNYIEQNDLIYPKKIIIDLLNNYKEEDGEERLKELLTQNLKLVNKIYEKLKIQIVIITKVTTTKISESMTDIGDFLCGMDLKWVVRRIMRNKNTGLRIFESENLLILSKPYLKGGVLDDAKMDSYKQIIKDIVENE